MLRFHRTLLCLAALAGGATMALYAIFGLARPPAQWNGLDIAGAAALALLACCCFIAALYSRRPCRVTTWLAAGLGALMLGALARCMDQFFSAAGQPWHHLAASGTTLAGMACLALALYLWRSEQWKAIEKRERMFRGHRSFDQLTQVGDADYLREQLRIEYQHGGDNCCLLMLDIDSFHLVNRDFGRREGDRVLQSVAQVLLLNLRASDLLCRYAGDRFAVLLPGTRADAALALADHLRRAVASLRHHAQRGGAPITPTLRYTFRNVDAEPRQLLRELNRALERRMPLTPYDQAAPASAAALA